MSINKSNALEFAQRLKEEHEAHEGYTVHIDLNDEAAPRVIVEFRGARLRIYYVETLESLNISRRLPWRAAARAVGSSTGGFCLAVPRGSRERAEDLLIEAHATGEVMEYDVP